MTAGVVGWVVGLLVAGVVLVLTCPAGRPAGSPPSRRRPGVASLLVTRLGRSLRRRAGRADDPEADRRLGLSVALAVAGTAVDPVVGLVLAVAPWFVHVRRTRRARRRAYATSVRELPDVVDLFRVAVGGGLTVHDAVREVGAVVDGPLADALGEVRRRVDLGDRLSDALPLVGDVGDELRPLVRVLLSGERDGVALVAPLARVAEQARDVRRRHAEEAARRVPVQLLFPLIACVLPAFVLLTVVPLLAGTVRSLVP